MAGLPDSVVAVAWVVQDADPSGVRCLALSPEPDRDFLLSASADVEELPDVLKALSHSLRGALRSVANQPEPEDAQRPARLAKDVRQAAARVSQQFAESVLEPLVGELPARERTEPAPLALQALRARAHRWQGRPGAQRAWPQVSPARVSRQVQSAVQAWALPVAEAEAPGHEPQAREPLERDLGNLASLVWPRGARVRRERPAVSPLPSRQPHWPPLPQPPRQPFPVWSGEPSRPRPPGSSWNASSSR